ncbi:MAG: GNAT family N-acetyltransferase [Bacilli bacterium]|nr:GNAT family N-acetyltransferase [Bacilli bacterium]
MRELEFVLLTEKDIIPMTKIMKEAFDADSLMHLGKIGGPPGYDNGEFLRKYGLHEKSTAYKILLEKEAIGVVILWINEKTNINFLGCIFIDPKVQDQGLGLDIWKMIEKMYPDTIKWCTETPTFSRRNHNFYVNKCGFHIVKIDNPHSIEEGSFNLEKVMKKG